MTKALPREKHCYLCKHSKMDFTAGLLCGLTDKKADFSIHCPVFEFRDDIKFYNETMRQSVDAPELQDKYLYQELIKYMLVGLFTLFGAYLLHQRIWDEGFISNIPLFIASFGLISMGNGIRILVRGKKDKKMAMEKYEEYVELVQLYQRQGHGVSLTTGASPTKIRRN